MKQPGCPLCDAAGGRPVVETPRWRLIHAEEAGYPAFYRVVWQEHVREPAHTRHPIVHDDGHAGPQPDGDEAPRVPPHGDLRDAHVLVAHAASRRRKMRCR